MTRIAPVRVLVLDDEEAACRRIAAWLAQANFDVVTFTSLETAELHLQRAPVHVALVDCTLPDLEATVVLDRLRSAAPRMRSIAMAAFPQTAFVLEVIRNGARDLLEKPVSEPALRAAIERQLPELGLSTRTENELQLRIGQRLRTLRAAAGKTQAELAEDASVSPALLSQIESGRSATSIWTLARLCAAMGQPISAVFQGL